MATRKKPTMLRDIADLLMEEGAPINPSDPQPIPMELQNLSLDMKVDSYFMKYEKESLPTQQNYQVPGTDLGAPAPPQNGGIVAPAPVGGIQMEQGFKKTFLALLEADGDDPMGGDPMGGGMDDPTGGDQPAAPAAPTEPQVENPRFNVRNFAQSVGRLVLNYEGLLDPKSTILNRAKAYVEKNYDAGVAKQMMDILSSQFQLAPRVAGDTTPTQAPPAAGAWSGVGGGGG